MVHNIETNDKPINPVAIGYLIINFLWTIALSFSCQVFDNEWKDEACDWRSLILFFWNRMPIFRNTHYPTNISQRSPRHGSTTLSIEWKACEKTWRGVSCRELTFNGHLLALVD